MVCGDAFSVTVGDGVTVTVAVAVAEPEGPTAVMMYVVVVAGDTGRVPDATGVTEPIPWLMLTEVALADVHDSVDDWPAAIDAGDAESVTVVDVGGGVPSPAMVQAVPPKPARVVVHPAGGRGMTPLSG